MALHTSPVAGESQDAAADCFRLRRKRQTTRPLQDAIDVLPQVRMLFRVCDSCNYDVHVTSSSVPVTIHARSCRTANEVPAGREMLTHPTLTGDNHTVFSGRLFLLVMPTDTSKARHFSIAGTE